MANRLDEIVAATRRDLILAKERHSLLVLEQRILSGEPPPRRDFLGALRVKTRGKDLKIIAELKRHSPALGPLQTAADPSLVAASYEAGGAAAISVLTEPHFFKGAIADLEEARAACALPILRKDFMVDRWQIAQARLMGADAVLLIVAVLGEGTRNLVAAAEDYGLPVLVEVHDRSEMEIALHSGARAIGVNNRNLTTFAIDLATAETLRAEIPEDRIAIAESGLNQPADFVRMAQVGYDAVLVGTALMRSSSPTVAIQQALAAVREGQYLHG
ncbi:MAG: indole-3-glycerol phosphate synthase TrpC [Candidatus Pacebacteria bacterium]|nr:indole-3-glycerol phosphate synthase TrpC [Candidatus Paceibacterota bacterium]